MTQNERGAREGESMPMLFVIGSARLRIMFNATAQSQGIPEARWDEVWEEFCRDQMQETAARWMKKYAKFLKAWQEDSGSNGGLG